jgi:predicted nuclease of predicted toxin-antitoxin system
MTLLLDQNLSHKLVARLAGSFADMQHVYLLGLHEKSDREIWEYAKKNNLCIVTQDADFSEMVALYGFSPKVIWLRIGNTTTEAVANALAGNTSEISSFLLDPVVGIFMVE